MKHNGLKTHDFYGGERKSFVMTYYINYVNIFYCMIHIILYNCVTMYLLIWDAYAILNAFQKKKLIKKQ
jgi:hypothetical protein